MVNRLFGELGRLRIALGHFELVLDRSPKNLQLAFMSTSSVALANANVIRPKQTIARNMRGVTAAEGGGGENAWISGPKHP
jgi:hypothetical protein